MLGGCEVHVTYVPYAIIDHHDVEDDGNGVAALDSFLAAGVLPNWRDCLPCVCVSAGAEGGLRLPARPLQ